MSRSEALPRKNRRRGILCVRGLGHKSPSAGRFISCHGVLDQEILALSIEMTSSTGQSPRSIPCWREIRPTTLTRSIKLDSIDVLAFNCDLVVQLNRPSCRFSANAHDVDQLSCHGDRSLLLCSSW